MTLKDAATALSDAGIEDALYEARLIFSEALGIPMEKLVFENPEANKEAEEAIKRRVLREPLAYILGYAYFYREKYKVNEFCLVPRQETELLVDYAVKNIPEGENFLDLCTGSGCIAISVLNNTKKTRALAADISEGAIAAASENAKSYGLEDRAAFIHADVLKEALGGEVYAVLSNPPYVKDCVYPTLSNEVLCEPKTALVGGEDGADFYRRLTSIYKDRIKKDGFILYEIGFDQGDILKGIAEENTLSCEIMKDYAGLDRMALLKHKI